MSQSLVRAEVLMGQGRHELALEELQRQLADAPDDAYVHSLMAHCLTELKRYDEAVAQAQLAVHLEPDNPQMHYALASVEYHRDRYRPALASIEEAIRLDPNDADFYGLLAAIHIENTRWAKALDAASQGLAIDPEHAWCNNLQAMALVKLGRKEQAGQTIDSVLRRNPEDALSHANQGWTYLEKRQPEKAMEHFREALRLDPEMEWARAGIVEAMKARHFIYRLLLGYFLWMDRFSTRAQWGIIIAGVFGMRMLRSFARQNPDFAPFVMPIFIVYLLFVLLTWIGDPLFNLVLRTSRFGRLALSREQMIASNWLAACLLSAAVLAAASFLGMPRLLIPAIVCGLMTIPVSAIYRCRAGWPRTSIVLYCAGLVGLGVLASMPPLLMPGLLLPFQSMAFLLFIVGILASTWVAGLLISVPGRS